MRYSFMLARADILGSIGRYAAGHRVKAGYGKGVELERRRKARDDRRTVAVYKALDGKIADGDE